MIRLRSRTLALAAFALTGLTACGGATATPTSAPATAAPSVVGASESPGALPSGLAIPSFEFPSQDSELEALLPDQLCGSATVKFSLSGDTFANSADAEFIAILEQLGKTPADVGFAVAGGTNLDGCSAGIFRIKGADANRFKDVFLAEAAKAGTVYEEKSAAGRTVLVGDGEEFQYAYFTGDALIFVGAPSEAKAAEVLELLP
ncbi:MAG: hypothetical protein ACRDIL_07265 [Candidatus Limnocylindrales bacterium]